MGGLAARCILETPDRDPGCVGDLFLVGTPNHGSVLARFEPHLEFVERFLQKQYVVILQPGWGKAADDLMPGSDFLKALNARPRNRGVQYHLVIGRRSFLRKSKLEAIADEADGTMERRGLPLADRRALGELLRSDELREGRGDGVVSIERAKLDGVASEHLLDLNHCELIVPSDEKPNGPADVVETVLQQLAWK